MEKNGIVYVSHSTTERAFRKFNLRKRRGIRPDLEPALEFFRERIQERYLDQIHLLNRDPFCNGFASMALCCLLIDTFYQFEHGVAKTTQNHGCYVNFLREHMRDVFYTPEMADRFYTDIRCGILHSAQTKNGSRLSADQASVVRCLDGGDDSPISVDVKSMEERLTAYFHDYCARVRTDQTCQTNFAKKINIMFVNE